MTPDPHRVRRASPGMACAAAFLLAATCAAADAGDAPRDTVCRAIRGMLVPECNAAICNQGRLDGDLRGHFVSKVTSIYPAGSGWLYTSWTRIELADGKGRIETTNDGIAPFDARRGPDLANSTEVLSIGEASGAYQDHFGTLVLTGAFALGRPTPYAGRLCHHGVSH